MGRSRKGREWVETNRWFGMGRHEWEVMERIGTGLGRDGKGRDKSGWDGKEWGQMGSDGMGKGWDGKRHAFILCMHTSRFQHRSVRTLCHPQLELCR